MSNKSNSNNNNTNKNSNNSNNEKKLKSLTLTGYIKANFFQPIYNYLLSQKPVNSRCLLCPNEPRYHLAYSSSSSTLENHIRSKHMSRYSSIRKEYDAMMTMPASSV